MSRARWAAAALALVTTGATALLVSFTSAQAAAPDPTAALAAAAEATTTVSSNGGTRTLIVDPTTDLAGTNASIKVQGKGFDTDHGLYVAVCAGAEGAPDLTTCIGGAIPDANTTQGWAHITEDGTGPGGVLASWQPGGDFSVTLVLPSATAGGVNCATNPCSLYTTSDDDSIRTEDNAVPLTFAAPSSSSLPPTPPGTAIPQNIASPTIVAGGTQSVIFSGFRPNEQVNLTLFSAPITLSPVTADGTGVAQVEFIVPADFAAGTHRLEAIGQESQTVGVASFEVTAPPVTPTPSPTPTPTPTPTPSPTTSSPATSPSAATSSALASSAVTSSNAAAPTDSDEGSSLWWLWLIIAIVVIAGIVTGIVVYRRNQQQQREQDEKDIADAAAQESSGGGQAGPYPPPTPYGADAPTVFLPPVQQPPDGPPPGADPYGLLSGRDHPDNPSLYSGDPAGPTEVLGPQSYEEGPGPYGQPLGYGGPAQGYSASPGSPGYVAPPEYGGPRPDASGGPPTAAMPPASGGAADVDGPGTQAWSPDYDGTDTGEAGNGGGGPANGDRPDADGDRR